MLADVPRIALDSVIWIEVLIGRSNLARAMQPLMDDAQRGQIEIIISEVSVAEVVRLEAPATSRRRSRRFSPTASAAGSSDRDSFSESQCTDPAARPRYLRRHHPCYCDRSSCRAVLYPRRDDAQADP